MPFNFFKGFGSKTNVGDLKTLQKDITQVEFKIYQATRIRGKILDRINQACEALTKNPSDKAARKTLVISLERERKFLDIIRNGIKNGISILEITLKELKKAGMDPTAKAEMLQTVQFLIDTMQFAKGKIKVIEKRIKNGEKLEEKDYAGQHLNEFLQTLKDEEKIDMELALVLEGKSKQVRSKLNILGYMVKDPYIRVAGLASAAVTTGAAFGGSSYYNALGVSPPTDSIPALAATIIGVSVAIMVILAHSTFSYEEGRRKLKGKVGDIIHIPR